MPCDAPGALHGKAFTNCSPAEDTGVVLMVWLLALAAISLPLPVLTALGAHRRGNAVQLAVLAGLFFPVTWTVWYLRDEHPYRRTHGHVA